MQATSTVGLVLLLAPAAFAADGPNVLLIIADDLGVANIGVYTIGPDADPGDDLSLDETVLPEVLGDDTVGIVDFFILLAGWTTA